MNVKKAGFITAGTVAALVAVSPMAFATEDAPHHPAAQQCAFEGGDGGAGSAITGDSLANAVAQAPIAGNNVANAGNCSEFLNDNANGNGSGNVVDVLGGLLP